MVYVDDPVEVLSHTEPCARTEHTCGECRRTIRPGERYERVAFVFEGDFTTHKTCQHCLVFIAAVDAVLDRPRDERGITFGAVWDLDPLMGTAGEAIEYDLDRDLVIRLRDLALGGWEGIAPEWVSGLLVVDNGSTPKQPLHGAQETP